MYLFNFVFMLLFCIKNFNFVPQINYYCVSLYLKIKVFKNLTSLLKINTSSKSNTSKAQNVTTTNSDDSNLNKLLKTKSLNDTKTFKNIFLSITSNSSFSSSSNKNNSKFIENTLEQSSSSSLPPPGYLVWSEYCKMPNLDPYLPEVMKDFRREKYKPCKLISPLTRIDFNRTTKRYVLSVDQEFIPGYSKTGKLDCCYQSIIRNGTGENADRHVR